MRILACLVLLLMSACATGEGALEVSYSSAVTGALMYVQLPPCETADKPLCSDTETVVKIKSATGVAYRAVVTARELRTSVSLSKADTAIGVLKDLLSSPSVTSSLATLGYRSTP